MKGKISKWKRILTACQVTTIFLFVWNIRSYHMSVYRNMPIPSYPEWFQVYVAPVGTDHSSVSVFDNASLSNTLGKNTAIASSSSSSSSLSAETRTPSKNISENNLAVAPSSPSSSEINLHLHHLILRRII